MAATSQLSVLGHCFAWCKLDAHCCCLKVSQVLQSCDSECFVHASRPPSKTALLKATVPQQLLPALDFHCKTTKTEPDS